MNQADKILLTIVIPVYNEQEVLSEFHRRLCAAIATLNTDNEIIYINDGSTDNSLDIIKSLYTSDDQVALVDLSRNFGKEIALSAGLHKAHGDAVVVIDADLQDPPELIPQLIAEWQQGYDVVYCKRKRRAGESLFKKFTAHGFYRVMQTLGKVKLPEDTGDFRILSRRAVDALNSLGEHHRFMKGLFTWIGFRQKALLYDREPRQAGKTKWNYWRLWNFALEGITSFTIAPLKFATYIGFLTALGAFIYGIYMVVRTLMYGNPVPGYPSLIVIVLFLGGAQLMAIGILGEYIGRIFTETKRRPLYFLNDYRPARQQRENASIANKREV